MLIGIIVFIAIAFLFLYFGYLKSDYTTLLFASITFFLLGLNCITNGIEGLIPIYSRGIGILLIGYGTYIGFRSGIELIRRWN